jgi:hypothetical protein
MHRCTLSAGQQLTDRSGVQPVGLAPAVALLLAHRSHLPRVEQPHHQPVTITQVTDQRLVMVPGRLHTDHHHMGVQPVGGGGDQALELGQASPVGDQADAVDHDLPEQVGGHDKPGRLGHIDADQQHPLRVHATHQLQEPPARWPQCGHRASSTRPFCRLLSVTDSSLAGRAHS